MAARKSNKTAHVLNLISKAKEEHQSAEDDFEINSIDNNPTNDLSFMNTEISNDKELAEEIKDSLFKIIESDDSSNLVNDSPVVMEKKEEFVIDANDALNTDLFVNATEHTNDSLEIESPTEDIQELNAIPSDQNDPGYSYINVIEEVVKLRVDEFIDMFGVCNCPRCRTDVIALALNDLPPKYIVVDSSHVSPLLNFFSNHYSGAVTAQLSRACTIVKDNPHH